MATDDANPRVLNRDAALEFAQSIKQPLDNLAQITDYMTHLVLRCWVSSKREIEDIVVLFAMLKNAVGMLDAVETMLRSGVVQPAMLQVRALFEASATIDWILKTETKKRARAYHIANLRRERLWALRYLPNTEEHTAFSYFWDTVGERPPGVEKAKELQEGIAEIDRQLSIPELADLNSEFQRQYDRSGYETDWYRALGVRSFRKIAEDVGRLPEYSIVYSWGSSVMHGSTYSGQLGFAEGDVVTDPLRSPERIDNVMSYAMAFAIKLIRSVLEHYRSGEIQAFNRKYATEWKFPLSNMPKITVEPIVNDL